MVGQTPLVEREVFDASGVVHRPGAVPADEARAMRDCLCEALQELGGLVEQEGALRPPPGSENAMAEVVQRPAFDGVAAHLARSLDAVFGADQWSPTTGMWRGVALPNLPGSGGLWTVPHRCWHMDEPTSSVWADARSLGAFVFLDRVVAGGGTTVVMTGSPRRLRLLAADLAPERALSLEESTWGLARLEPWVHQLLHPGPDPDARRRQFMTDGCISGTIPLRIVELTGEPGDVVLMDLRGLHAPSANVSGQARLVVKMACIKVKT